jgi:hypothetical protein
VMMIALTFTFIALNTTKWRTIREYDFESNTPFTVFGRGWPLSEYNWSEGWHGPQHYIDVVNAFVCVAIITAFALLSEVLIRRAIPRPQLHLSTLMLITVVAAGMMWLNVQVGPIAEVYLDGAPVSISKSDIVRGWPLWCFKGGIGWNSLFLAVDITVCLVLLTAAAVAIEWVTRRVKRKPPHDERTGTEHE